MKLPNESASTRPLTDTALATPPKAAGQTGPADSQTLRALVNTQATVTSSETLTPQQSAKALQNLANPPVPASAQTGPQSGLQAPATEQTSTKTTTTLGPSTDTSKASPNTESLANKAQLQLITLSTIKGDIQIVSPNRYPVGSQVIISQTPQGQWQLQTPASGFSLANMLSQLSAGTLPPLNLSGFDAHQPQLTANLNGPQALMDSLMGTLNKLAPPLPQHIISSQLLPDAQAIKQAIASSGLFLENQLSNGLGAKPLTSDGQTGVANSAPSASKGFDINARFQQVETQIGKWVEALNLTGKSSATATQQTSNPSNNVPTHSLTNTLASPLTTSQPSNTLEANNPSPLPIQDNKVWLQLWQQQLLKAWQANLASPAKTSTNNQVSTNINNPLSGAINQAAQLNPSINATSQPVNANLKAALTALHQVQQFNGPSVGDKQQLSQLLEFLMSNKFASKSSNATDLPIWPKNLSVQSQLQQLIQQNLGQLSNPDSNQSQHALLRQLAQISQTLMNVQHEQVQAKLGQLQQPDNPAFNVSLPYLHQQQLQWCQLEFQQHPAKPDEPNLQRGWHLVLRFMADTPKAFAIESQLNRTTLAMTLWANEQDQLANLFQHSQLLRGKLQKAGFVVEQLSSKHGMPPKKHQQLQQNLVDVHT